VNKIGIGVDVSKGYADIEFANESRTILGNGGRHDDTKEGHQEVERLIIDLKKKNPECVLIVGIEASGGYERNWLKFFRELNSACNLEVLHLNAYAVRKYFERNLRRNKTDKLSARNIAEYVLYGRRRQEVDYEPKLEGCRTLYRAINSLTGRRVQIQTQLQTLLSAAQPDLVQFCRGDIPDWVLEILMEYPTASHLARARVSSLCKINRVTKIRAAKLIENSKKSVASQVDQQTAITIAFLAKEILGHNQKTKDLSKDLLDSMKEDQAIKIIDSIPGIGLWTAMVLRLEYGSIERFYSADAAVAYAGLDPRIDESGDSRRDIGISRAGREQIRQALYMPTRVAVRYNPAIRVFYQRLLANGKNEKVALVACMAKLIRFVYACWITGKPFDPNYSAKSNPQILTGNKHPKKKSKTVLLSLSSPISAREAKKRKAVASPQNGVSRFIRGHGTALINDHTNKTT
jgi:transposase